MKLDLIGLGRFWGRKRCFDEIQMVGGEECMGQVMEHLEFQHICFLASSEMATISAGYVA